MPFAVAAAGISAAAGIGGAMMSSSASKSAANTQAAAANQAAQMQQAQYEQTRSDLLPFINNGQYNAQTANSVFGMSNQNPLLVGSPSGGGGGGAGGGGGGGGAPQGPAPAALTMDSAPVQQLATNLSPSIAAAISSGAASGSLAGGYTFKQTAASGPTFTDHGPDANPTQDSAGTPGTFQLIDPNGNPVGGSYSDDPSQAGGIASALALGYGNAAQTQQYAASGGGGPATPPSVLGLNDSQYGIPALGETNFFKAMGVNGPADLAFNPTGGNDFFKAMGVNGPADLQFKPQGGSNFYAAMGVNGPQDLAFNPTQATLDNMPGYQFERDQGLAATQNSAAAKGLGVSGAAMKAAAGYAQGLASTDLSNYYNQYEGNLVNSENIFSKNYNDQLAGWGQNLDRSYNTFSGNYGNQLKGWDTNLTDLSNTFNNNLVNRFNMNQDAVQKAYGRMSGMAALGESAAAQSGITGQAGAAAAGTNITGAGNAIAAGQMGQANALMQGMNSVASAPLNYQALQNQQAQNQYFQNANGGGYNGTPTYTAGDNGLMQSMPY